MMVSRAGCPHANKLPLHAGLALHTQRRYVRMQSWLSICVEDASACGNGSRPVWGVDSVKSTVTVLEEGNFTEEGGGFD